MLDFANFQMINFRKLITIISTEMFFEAYEVASVRRSFTGKVGLKAFYRSTTAENLAIMKLLELRHSFTATTITGVETVSSIDVSFKLLMHDFDAPQSDCNLIFQWDSSLQESRLVDENLLLLLITNCFCQWLIFLTEDTMIERLLAHKLNGGLYTRVNTLSALQRFQKTLLLCFLKVTEK